MLLILSLQGVPRLYNNVGRDPALHRLEGGKIRTYNLCRALRSISYVLIEGKKFGALNIGHNGRDADNDIVPSPGNKDL